MSDARVTVSRLMVGVCALICLLTAAGLWTYELTSPETPSANSVENGDGESITQWSMIKAAFTRIGLLMGAVWIALPPGKRNVEVSPKAFVIGLAAIIGMVVRPRFTLLLLFVLAVLAKILRPKDKNREQAELARKYRAGSNRP